MIWINNTSKQIPLGMCSEDILVEFSDGKIEEGKFYEFFWCDDELSADDTELLLVSKWSNVEGSPLATKESYNPVRAINRIREFKNSSPKVNKPMFNFNSTYCSESFTEADIQELRECYEYDANPLLHMD